METKEQLQTLLQKLTLSKPVRSSLEDFLATYEGNYTKELVTLIVVLLITDTTNTGNSSKVEAFDEIIQANSEDFDKLEDLGKKITEMNELLSTPVAS